MPQTSYLLAIDHRHHVWETVEDLNQSPHKWYIGLTPTNRIAFHIKLNAYRLALHTHVIITQPHPRTWYHFNTYTANTLDKHLDTTEDSRLIHIILGFPIFCNVSTILVARSL